MEDKSTIRYVYLKNVNGKKIGAIAMERVEYSEKEHPFASTSVKIYFGFSLCGDKSNFCKGKAKGLALKDLKDSRSNFDSWKSFWSNDISGTNNLHRVMEIICSYRKEYSTFAPKAIAHAAHLWLKNNPIDLKQKEFITSIKKLFIPNAENYSKIIKATYNAFLLKLGIIIWYFSIPSSIIATIYIICFAFFINDYFKMKFNHVDYNKFNKKAVMVHKGFSFIICFICYYKAIVSILNLTSNTKLIAMIYNI